MEKGRGIAAFLLSSMIDNHDTCPLCGSGKVELYCEDNRRQYWLCSLCCLVFVPRAFHLSPSDEKREYDKHQNGPEDTGYQAFLARLVTPMLAYLAVGSSGLDFGCGPGPATPAMFAKKEISIDLYDPIYVASFASRAQHYDFVICTEVAEHMRQPRQSWDQLRYCVKCGGLVGIMTKLVINRERFQYWHYKNDPTHIAFYSHKTLAWIAQYWGAELNVVAKDAFIFHLP